MSEVKGGYCQTFCLCSSFHIKEMPQKVVDFINRKRGKPILPKDMELFLDPEASLMIMTEALMAKATVNVRYSKEIVEKKIQEMKKYELSDKNKQILLNLERTIPLKEKRLKKPYENFVLFKIQVSPRVPKENFIKVATLEELLKSKEIEDFCGLMKEVCPEPLNMTTCVEHEYEADKFKPTGGLMIPTKIPLPAELGTRFGKSELDGISIRFKESAMGLEYIQMSLENETSLLVGLRASYKLTHLEEMLKKAYELSNEIADLLVEKVK